MKTYQVEVVKRLTQNAILNVEAESEEQAILKAEEAAYEEDQQYAWDDPIYEDADYMTVGINDRAVTHSEIKYLRLHDRICRLERSYVKQPAKWIKCQIAEIKSQNKKLFKKWHHRTA